MYIRKTKDIYILQGNYGYGWDDLTIESTYKEAKEQKATYDHNENIAHRIIKKREAIK